MLRSLVWWLGTDLIPVWSFLVIPFALLLLVVLGCSFSALWFPHVCTLIVLGCLLEGGLYRPRVSSVHPSSSVLCRGKSSNRGLWLPSSTIPIGRPPGRLLGLLSVRHRVAGTLPRRDSWSSFSRFPVSSGMLSYVVCLVF